MVKEEEAFKAIKGLNGYCLDGVTIDVEVSRLRFFSAFTGIFNFINDAVQLNFNWL